MVVWSVVAVPVVDLRRFDKAVDLDKAGVRDTVQDLQPRSKAGHLGPIETRLKADDLGSTS